MIWGHSSHAAEVFGLQRKCIRAMAGLGYRVCCRQHFIKFGILTLPCAYILRCLLYIKENLGHYSMHCDVHTYPTRFGSNIVPEFRRLARARTGTSYYCVKFFNALPPLIRLLNEQQFKLRIRVYLIAKAFYTLDEFLNSSFHDM